MEAVSKPSKLVINLREGILDVQGEESFVRSIYDDFKERIGKAVVIETGSAPQFQKVESSSEAVRQIARKKKIKPVQSTDGKVRVGEFKPSFNANLNLTGLSEFYKEWAPKNHPETILVFAIFLRDRLNIFPCTANDIYTCYFTLKSQVKTPEAFVQAFRNAENRTHYIRFESVDKIEITIAGDNFFAEKKAKGDAK